MRRREPPRPEEVFVVTVTQRALGRIVHHRLFPSGGRSVGWLLARARLYSAWLSLRFSPGRYHIQDGIYDSRETFYERFPECRPSDGGSIHG